MTACAQSYGTGPCACASESRRWLLLAVLAAGACSCIAVDPAALPGGRGLPLGGVPRAGRRGRPHHYAYFSERAPCAILQRRYVPSPLEARWVEAAAAWKAAGNGDVHDITPYCQLLVDTLPAIQRMLALVAELMAGNSTRSDAADADGVLSHFMVTLQCGPYELEVKEHIESLVAALRHPFSIACPEPAAAALPPKADMFDKGYVLLASWAGQVQGARNKYYLDAGAGVGYLANSNQHWMIESYAARGIVLDRALFWEAGQQPGGKPLADVPPDLFPAFAFYNIPAPASLEDGRNPLRVATKLARPEDFLSVKLDIDAPEVEDGWLRAIIGNGTNGQPSVYAELIDELFWEHHFTFKPMQDCCWQGLVDRGSQLGDSMRMFQQLRALGIRAHYWQ